jgi:4,5-DOPA dioxygenase extradiol
MQRSAFLKLLSLSPLALAAMKLQSLESITKDLKPTEKMPVLFLGQ